MAEVRSPGNSEPQRATAMHRGPGTGHGGPAAHFRKPVEKPRELRETVHRLWQYIRRQRKEMTAAVILVLFTTALNLLGPSLIAFAIDAYIIPGVQPQKLFNLILIMAAVYILSSFLTFLQNWIMIGVSETAVRNLRKEVFGTYQRLSVEYFDRRNLGELMSRITNDIGNISNTLSNSFLQLVAGVFSIAAVIIIMLILNWQLGLICIGIIPIVIFVTKTLASHTRSGFRFQQRYLGELNGYIEENISGLRVIKAFAKENELLEYFGTQNRRLKEASRRAQIFAGFMGPIMNMMNNLNYAVTAFAGGVLSLFGLVSIGTIAAFLSYTRQFARPLNQIAQVYNTIQSAIAGAERVFEILDEPVEQEPADTQTGERFRGEVRIEHLNFRYVENMPVLKEIALHALPGQIIALVGPTGAGKTTIVNLLTRFYEIKEGSISIDGTDIRNIPRNTLRSQLGIVLQDTFLFSDTVKENIRYGRLDASDEEIIEAAKISNAHQFIHRMPQGYDTPITEAGTNLSQGQKQLLAITRAVLSDPSILILDEATSSVDTRTEMHIQEAMLKLMEGRTSFVIAHRLSTIKQADQILVIDKGTIIEQGTHKQLLHQMGFYHTLYNSQFTTKRDH